MTAILGISAFYHDSAAALLVDGEIVAAAQEERFTRKKHDADFPVRAVAYCLKEAGLRPEQLDYVGFYDKPYLKFERLLETYLAYAPLGVRSFLRAMPVWLKQKLHLPREIRIGLGGGYTRRVVFAEHHESHAASAFFPSPFEEAALLTLDGVGEWTTTSLGVGRGNQIRLTHEIRFPHSLGLLYTAFTGYCGFQVNADEYKLMGLAPYGEPRYADTILAHLIDLKPDGSFRLSMQHLAYPYGPTMTSPAFHELFDGPPRRPEEPLDQRHMDVAASIQHVTEEVMLRCARRAHELSGSRNLCLAGGVALNCVGNGRILREGPFENIWIQPAAGDAGGALGAALFIWHQLLGNDRAGGDGDRQRGSLLGCAFEDEEIQSFLETTDAPYERIGDDAALCRRVAAEIETGKVVGWFQGRMEFGPRALGARSILGDARHPRMQSIINAKVKFREGFRPFAPVVLAEKAHEYFGVPEGLQSPYMLLVAPVRDEMRRAVPKLRDASSEERLHQPRSVIPAVTHVDGSARIQTVDERHGLLRRLLEAFYAATGCPLMVNTSFNLGWDPIAASPRDAYETFMGSEIDVLCMGHFLLTKTAQPASVAKAVGGSADEVLDPRLASPCCCAELRRDGPRRVCARCERAFASDGDIPLLFSPHEDFGDTGDVTEQVKAFYEATPFPNYDDHESVRSLIEKSHRGVYARTLDRSIPHNTAVLEVGCGTGQLSNFLGVSCRQVIGADLCLNSLRLGEAFRKQHGLSRVRFVQMNLFRPAFRPEQFDVVLCNGVLHHTSDPYGGFRGLLPLVRPGGHIVVALYNRWGRLATDLRRLLFRATAGRGRWIDPILRQGGRSEAQRRAWFEDQYRHPHESKHTIGELLGWFDDNGVEFVSGVPSVTPFAPPLDGQDLFEPKLRGSAFDHFLVQAAQIAAGSREGGFFILVARKTAGAVARREAA